jgi:hypothetical protein
MDTWDIDVVKPVEQIKGQDRIAPDIHNIPE